MVGVVLAHAADTHLSRHQLKPILESLDHTPLLSAELLKLIAWAADYYHHPVGEVLQTALPVGLRQGAQAVLASIERWRLTAAGQAIGPERLRRAPMKQRLWQALTDQGPLSASALAAITPRWRTPLAEWEAAGLVAAERVEIAAEAKAAALTLAPVLMSAQAAAAGRIAQDRGAFQVHLLYGITGSGKTEVYLDVIAHLLALGRQVLVLVPEIGLTPQLLRRFEGRFPVPVLVAHSGLNETERLNAWLQARAGHAAVLIGTRSAVFAPLPRLGAIIIDEEHDTSFKQQDGFRYHARDVAIVRAREANIPIVLGSATPSLESMANARQARYHLLTLPERAGSACLPDVQLLDMRRLKPHDGLSHPLLEAIRARIARSEQSLLFLNRRGFAPVLMCYDCGWLAPCRRCDARLTLHRRRAGGILRCHHCGAEQAPPVKCPACAGENLHGVGEGTQRIESALANTLPGARIVRIDRDSTRRKGELEARLESARAGEADVLVGTQMLSKGHDFPNVTLVGVLNADHGFYGVDFRAGEQLFQQIMQVAGRAGRADKPGQVLIQTYHPDHPLFSALQRHDYTGFADFTLAERRDAGYPPFAHFALLRAESPKESAALRFLHHARELAKPLSAKGVQLMEPVPSPMERRAGRYRAQLLIQAAGRAPLHRMLRAWLDRIEQSKEAGKVRWSLDVDPVTTY